MEQYGSNNNCKKQDHYKCIHYLIPPSINCQSIKLTSQKYLRIRNSIQIISIVTQ